MSASKGKSFEQRIMIAANQNKGMRITAEQVQRLSKLHYIYQAAAEDDEDDHMAATYGDDDEANT